MNDTTNENKPTPYEVLGGEARLRELVERFYLLMDTVPEYYAVRKLHPEDLKGSTEKLFMFLSGWLGGPPRFVEQYGHPRLKARHLPFEIGKAERDQWMACMLQAMEEVDVPQHMREGMRHALFQTADWMRNREG